MVQEDKEEIIKMEIGGETVYVEAGLEKQIREFCETDESGNRENNPVYLTTGYDNVIEFVDTKTGQNIHLSKFGLQIDVHKGEIKNGRV